MNQKNCPILTQGSKMCQIQKKIDEHLIYCLSMNWLILAAWVELGKTFCSYFLKNWKQEKYLCFWNFFIFKDNDNWSSNCAIKGPFGNRGGWWFNRCTRSNLNGLNYADGNASVEWTGIYWFKFGGSKNSMKTVTMSVIPNNHCKYLFKAIETGIILLIVDIKKSLLCIFSKTYKLW